jgi:hypothetical protein
MNELCSNYNLDECIDQKLITTKLKQLEKDGKIDFKVSGDILKIEDIDLEDNDIDTLIKLFEDNDVFEEPDYEDEFGDNLDDDGFADYDDEY